MNVTGTKLKLNLGCGFDKLPGFINVDSSEVCEPDLLFNLEQTPWPFEESSVSEIRLKHVLEHLGQTSDVYLNIWKEIYRVCEHGARIDITVPHFRHENFFHDPTHVRAITPIGIAMFDQQRNKQDMDAGGSETKLGMILGIDFELYDTDIEYVYTREILEAIERGDITKETLAHITAHQGNIIMETHVRPRVVKPARYTGIMKNSGGLGEATALERRGDFDTAERVLKTLPQNTPGLPAKLGWHDIRNGDFVRGYPKLHEERAAWRAEFVFNLPLEKRYEPGVSLYGARIFIVPEGGLGDEILCARFVELYKKRGAYVILGCASSLHEILRTLPIPPDEIRAPESVLPHEYDYFVPSFSGVMALGLSHPSEGVTYPYLRVDSEKVRMWSSEIEQAGAGTLKIGIRWEGKQPPSETGQKRVEAIPFETFLPLRAYGTLFSFQRDSGLEKLREHPEIYDLGTRLTTWEDTLACMDEMDVIVTCCTSTAHAAGALGIPTYVVTVMNPYYPWAKEGNESEWYESVFVAKQKSENNWVSAMHEVIAGIQKLTPSVPDASAMNKPDESVLQTLFNKAHTQGEAGQYDEARDTYRELLEKLPEHSTLFHPTRYNLSWYEYREGNIRVASRYRVESGRALGFIINPTRVYDAPRLTPDTDVMGKTILLSSECGAGDEILSVRFAKILKTRGARRVIWVSSHGLASLFRRTHGIDEAVTPEEATLLSFDVWAFTLELPYLLGITMDDIKTPPYITPLHAHVEKWKTKIGNSPDLKVGIRWKGEPSRDASQMRALPFTYLERLTTMPGVRTYSLQRDAGVEDIGSTSPVVDLGSDFETWEDTVAAISLLDLVITSDTSIAHLAAAMGKETWVLVRSFPYFTWISNERGETPWYANARVFTESSKEDWNTVLPKIERELIARIEPENERDAYSKQIRAQYGNVTRAMYIHPERELVSEILRIQQWYSKRDLVLYNLFLAPGDACFDIGANIGWYTLYAADIVGNEGLVVAVEPDPANATLLRKNLHENAITNVDVRELALGSVANGTTQLYKSPDNFGDHYTDARVLESTDRAHVTVPTSTIDALVEEIGRVPRFIKIDVQGAEADVLRGAAAILQSDEKPVLLVEFAPACMLRIGASPFEFLAFIESHAYTPFRVYDDYSGKPLLAPLAVAELLEFIKENRTRVVGWDILLVPERDMHIVQSSKAASLFI